MIEFFKATRTLNGTGLFFRMIALPLVLVLSQVLALCRHRSAMLSAYHRRHALSRSSWPHFRHSFVAATARANHKKSL